VPMAKGKGLVECPCVVTASTNILSCENIGLKIDMSMQG
jgi:hypothetical protein